MIPGNFEGNIPYIPVMILHGGGVAAPFFVLDTGFTGDLLITSQMARELGIAPSGFGSIILAGGGSVTAAIGKTRAMLGDDPKDVEVVIADGMPLAGISLFTKFRCKILVDCNQRTVEVEN